MGHIMTTGEAQKSSRNKQRRPFKPDRTLSWLDSLPNPPSDDHQMDSFGVADLEESQHIVEGDQNNVIVTPLSLKPIVSGIVATAALLFVVRPQLLSDTLLSLLLFMPYPPHLRFARWIVLIPLLACDTIQGKLGNVFVFGILSALTVVNWGSGREAVDNHLVITPEGVIIKDLDEW